MRSVLHRAIFVTALLTSGFTFGQGLDSPEARLKIDSLPRDLEVDLAFSAAPPHLRAGATVFVLDPARGYVIRAAGKKRIYMLRCNELTTHVKSFLTTSLSQSAKTRKQVGLFGPWNCRTAHSSQNRLEWATRPVWFCSSTNLFRLEGLIERCGRNVVQVVGDGFQSDA